MPIFISWLESMHNFWLTWRIQVLQLEILDQNSTQKLNKANNSLILITTTNWLLTIKTSNEISRTTSRAITLSLEAKRILRSMFNLQKQWWLAVIIWTVNSQILLTQPMHLKRIREHTISKWAIRTSDQQLPPPRTVVLEIMSTNKQEEKSMLNYQSHQLLDRFQLRWLLIHASLILIKVATGSLRVMTTTQVQSRTW